MHEDFFKNIPDFFNQPHIVTIPEKSHQEIIKTLKNKFESIQAMRKKFYIKLRIGLKDMPVMYVYFGNSTDIAQSLEFWLFRNPTIQITAFRLDLFEHVQFMYSDNEDTYIDSWIFTFEEEQKG